MRITKIEPKRTDQYNTQYRLMQDIDEAFKDTNIQPSIYRDGAAISVTFRLKTPKFNTLAYTLSANYRIVYETNKKGEQVPYAQSLYLSDVKRKCRRMNALQEEDWVKVNETLNAICDKLDVSCTIRSALIKVRDGKRSVWLSQYVAKLRDESGGGSVPLSKLIKQKMFEKVTVVNNDA